MPSKGSAKGSGVPQSGGSRSRRRAVVFVPPARDDMRWIERCAAYCRRQRLEVVCVARRIGDAVLEVAEGRADVLVAVNAADVWPVIQFVTDERGELADPMLRRPQLLRTSRYYPHEDPGQLRPLET